MIPTTEAYKRLREEFEYDCGIYERTGYASDILLTAAYLKDPYLYDKLYSDTIQSKSSVLKNA